MSNVMRIHDFTRVEDAKQLAAALIEKGIQFAYCPHPISISHPLTPVQTVSNQVTKID